MDLNLVPYGNTRVSGTTFTCQHGADECRSDLFALCLLDRLGGVGSTIASAAAYPFVLCMEMAEGAPDAAPGCFDKTLAPNVEFTWADDILAKCADDPVQSIVIQQVGADATPKEHQYVPWVVIEGAVVDNPDPLLELVCTAYTGYAPLRRRGGVHPAHLRLPARCPAPAGASWPRRRSCASTPASLRRRRCPTGRCRLVSRPARSTSSKRPPAATAAEAVHAGPRKRPEEASSAHDATEGKSTGIPSVR